MDGNLIFLLVIAVIGISIAAIATYRITHKDRLATADLLRIDYQKRAAENEAAQRAREEAERQRDRAEQERYGREINTLNNQSIEAFERAAQTIEVAEQHLDRAEEDFAEGAFAPFWDEVERAATALGAFHENVRVINANSVKYVELTKSFRSNAESFGVSTGSPVKLKLATATVDRMNANVRNAQRNFQFAMIYEQRKTNQVLIAGFRSLAEALEEMTWRITSSVDELASSVDGMSSTLSNSLSEIEGNTAKLASAAEIQLQQVPARTAREEKALEMLDNIQRRRHPSALHGGLR